MKKLELNRFSIPVFGKYHKGVSDCPHCEFDFFKSELMLQDFAIGLHQHSVGLLLVIECPECFEKWSFHARGYGEYSLLNFFLESVENGKNKHFKPEPKSKPPCEMRA